MVADSDYLPDSPYMVNTVMKKYERELALLLSGTKILKYSADEVVFLKGEVHQRFYFIKKGRIWVTIPGPDGAEKIVAIHESNTFLGETGFDGYPYTGTAVTIEESELYLIEETHFESCVRRHPEVAFMILASVIRKARNAALQLGDLYLLKAKGRVASILLKLSDEIGTGTNDGIVIQRRITHETLAGLTGLARPTLTTVLNDLERSKVIRKKDHRVIIVDKKRLSNEIENIID